jgi:hypothetical protein
MLRQPKNLVVKKAASQAHESLEVFVDHFFPCWLRRPAADTMLSSA